MLDPQGRRDVIRIANDLVAQGITVVRITHFMEEALEADRVLVADKGRIVLDGTPGEVFEHGDELRKLGLE